MEMTLKAGAYDYNPNVRREGTPKYYQVMDRELLELMGLSSGFVEHQKP